VRQSPSSSAQRPAKWAVSLFIVRCGGLRLRKWLFSGLLYGSWHSTGAGDLERGDFLEMALHEDGMADENSQDGDFARGLARPARKMARRLVESGQTPARGRKVSNSRAGVAAEDLAKLLGPPKFIPDERQRADEVGIANGLAWTQAGGEVLHVEAQMMPGKGNLILTGQLGEVMKESAQAALSFARVQATRLGLRSDFLSDREIHIHVPAGGVPKDGPSAGVTMACVLVSLVAGIPVRRDVAMTGEITLRGKVLPIGGLKEKALAARRMGVKTVIVPSKNDKDVKELPANVRRGMQFVYVDDMDDVLKVALAKRASVRRAAPAASERRVAARA